MLKQMATDNDVVFLSLVVATNRPVKYLEDILRNVFLTSPVNIEVIVVNDDPNRKISKSDFDNFFSEINPTHKILFKLNIINNELNKGPGYSRNCGVDSAGGLYVVFVDDDDEFDLNVLKNLPNIKSFPDIVCLGFEDTSGVFTNYELQKKLPQIGAFEVQKLQQAFMDNTFLPAQIQPYLFKKEFLKKNKIKFPNAYVGEDLAFNTMVILSAETVINITGFFYKYISRPGTLKSSQGVNRSIDLLRCLLDLNNYKNKFNNLSELQKLFCYEIMYFYQSLFCMRVLLASNKTENIMSQTGLSDEKEIQLFKNVFKNKVPVTKLKYLMEKIADDIKKICILQLLPNLTDFQKVFIFCVGSLGRAVARLVSEGCKKEVIFVDAMFDKFPTKKVDGLKIVGPQDLYDYDGKKCVIVCNPQPAIERKIADSIKQHEKSVGFENSRLIFGSQLIKESASSFFRKCEVVL